MRRPTLGRFTVMASAVLLLAGCDGDRPLASSPDVGDLARASAGQSAIATLTRLPSLGGNSEALAVNDAGTVIAGHSFDRAGALYAVRWTLRSGAWVIGALPYPGSARATGVDGQGGAAGYAASYPRRALRWPAAGGSTLLDCTSDPGESTASGISTDGQVVVGAGAGVATVWRPGGCRESLPALGEGGYASAAAVNGGGTVVGGSASSSDASVPVRWREIEGQWLIERLDGRPGRALGASGAGDLAGYVSDPCALAGGCNRALVWYAAGGSLDLGAVLGAERSVAYDINARGEVVGVSTSNGRSSAFLWSASLGTQPLPVKGSDAAARAVSDARADGSRLVVGMAGTQAAVWVVRAP